MRYINPKTDFAFKKIFGSSSSQGILRSFLNGVLYDGEPRVQSLQIVDPYSIPRLQGMKDSYLDVRALLDDGQHVLIEMQVLNVPGFEKRVLYNAAKEYSNQLVKGQDYTLLNPVIALTLTDFDMFPEWKDQVISRFELKEKNNLIAYPHGDVELVFVELTKFNKTESELRSLADEWLYFVRFAAELNTIPQKLSHVEEIKEAFEIAEASSLTQEEEIALEKKLRWIADQRMLLAAKQASEQAAAKAMSENAAAQEARRIAEQRLAELALLAEQESQRAAQESQRAEQESQRAEQESLRASQASERAASAEGKIEQILQRALAALVAQGVPESEARRQLGLS
jgi:predicted transposase/invertase (TIGR01784 family)